MVKYILEKLYTLQKNDLKNIVGMLLNLDVNRDHYIEQFRNMELKILKYLLLKNVLMKK